MVVFATILGYSIAIIQTGVFYFWKQYVVLDDEMVLCLSEDYKSNTKFTLINSQSRR